MKKKRSKAKKKLITAAIIFALVVITAVVLSVISGKAPFDFGLKAGKLAAIYADSPTEGKIEVHVIDVGQADSTLIRSAGGNILIDAGTNDSESDLKAHLLACGIKRIDYLVCTHPHSDHIGGADMIVSDFDVGTVLMSDARTTDTSLERLLDSIESTQTYAEIPNIGDSYALGDIEFTVLGPISESDDLNHMSLVLKVTFGETSFLFTGDAEEASETELVASYPKAVLDCDFLKAGHHGSATSSCEAFLEAVTPKIAVISCGKDNSYGHPRGEVLERLSDAGCATVLRTDKSGTAVITSDGKTLTVAAP